MSVAAAAGPAPPKAGRREWIGLAVLALPCLIYSMDLTVLNLAIPAISRDLRPSAAQLLWIVDIYGFMVAGWLITMGTLGDRIGRRRLLMVGAAAFGAASVLAAMSTSAEMLIFARALLGVAGATIAPSTLSLIRNMFHDEHERTMAIGIWATSYSVGALIGPVLGGVILQYASWGAVFLLAVPVMVLLLAAAPSLLPEYRDPQADRLDVLSAGLSLSAVMSVVYGLKRIAEAGLSVPAGAAIVGGVILGLVFVRRQRRLADPLIDFSLFRSRAFSTALGTNMLACLVMFGVFLFIAQHLQLVLGLTPLEAGLWSLPSAAAVMVGSLAAPMIVRRCRPAYVVAGGLALLAAGLILLTQVDRGGLMLLVASAVIFSVGMGPIFVLTTGLIVGAAPPERAGAAGAISETGAELGGVLGIALLGSLGVAVYRTLMAGAIPPGVEAGAAEAARSLLAGAAAVAGDLDEATGRALLEAGRAAFTRSLQVTAGVCAALSLAGGVAALVLLKDARAPDEDAA